MVALEMFPYEMGEFFLYTDSDSEVVKMPMTNLNPCRASGRSILTGGSLQMRDSLEATDT